jgi:hypothetical protein
MNGILMEYENPPKKTSIWGWFMTVNPVYPMSWQKLSGSGGGWVLLCMLFRMYIQ